MQRQISAGGLRELFSQNSGDVLLALATFEHPDLPAPIRIVNDNQGLTYNGDAYQALPFKLTLPEDTEDSIPNATMEVDNIDRTLISILRSVNEPIPAHIEVVRVSSDGSTTPEVQLLNFSVLNARPTATKVTLTIGYVNDILNEPATQAIFNPGLAPALFR